VEARRALRAQEPAIAALIAGLEQRGLFDSTTLIFVSDHGMTSVDDRVLVGDALRAAGIEAFTTGIGGFASVYLEDSSDAEIARAISLVEGLGLAAVARARAPASLRVANPRFGDVVVGASPGTAISHEGLLLEGFHGYHPDEPEMSAFFVAAGRGISPGSRVSRVRSLDVAPTVLSLLGLPIPDWMEGRPIAGVGVAAPAPAPLASGRVGLQDSARHANWIRQRGGGWRASGSDSASEGMEVGW
jgi:arylsulfatase A-like enzyme